MESQEINGALLSHFITPAFFVEKGIITQVNNAAAIQMIDQGMPLEGLLAAGQEEYAQFTGGCIYLTLTIQGQLYSACVTRQDGVDLFIAEPQEEEPALQAYSLAARALREPLAGLMVATDRLFASLPESANAASQAQIASINQNLYKMLRILGNMSDASRFASGADVHMAHCNISSILDELFQQIEFSCEESGISFTYTPPEPGIYGRVDSEKLERGVYNLISNALKFTGKGGTVHAQATRQGKRLYISITDSSGGIPVSVHQTMFRRYLRSPGLEESRAGIGLGMLLAKSVASIHRGAILMQPMDNGTRITMTLRLDAPSAELRSPVLRVDYTGERSHSLVELADCLDPRLYTPENL